MDDELLRDFLVEAGELIDGIDGQLLVLENAPNDQAVLNGVFRTFHTIKGGAGFLGLKPLVAICHRVEDVLNLFRSGSRKLDAFAMDLVLKSVDEVKRMFAEIGSGKRLQRAPEALLNGLDAVIAESARNTAPAGSSSERSVVGVLLEDVMTDDEFDALLDALARGDQPAQPSSPPVCEAPPSAAARPERDAVEPPPTQASAHALAISADELAASPSGPAVEQSLRVDTGRIDEIMNMVGELVLVRNRLFALRRRVQDEEVHRALSGLNLVTSDLQTSVMRLRMQPVSKVFGRFPRVVRDLARQLGKEVELEMSGETTELDKGMVESLADPLVHLVRNAMDHGFELPEERARVGKPASGRLSMSARQEGSHIVITVEDDGGGLDTAVIRRKAVEKGLLDPRLALQISDADILQLVFAAGFSTKAVVSDISGRGVGLDVVKNQIARVNGTVDIQSEKGSGTRVVIRLPLTLAILPTLVVGVARQRFSLPLSVVEEIIDFDPTRCALLDGREVLSLRGEVVPLLDLERWVGAAASGAGSRSVVIANTGVRRIAVLVHRLIGQEEVVVKSLGPRLQGLPGFAGATITGDGGIALIVDVGSLFTHWRELAIHPVPRCAGSSGPVRAAWGA